MSPDKEEKILIDFGCGEGRIKKEGYLVIRLDKRKEAKPDILYDLEWFHYPFRDNSVNEIIWKDVLEHLSWRVTKKALEETYRILKRGGRVYIQCPDLEEIAKRIILNPEFRYGDLHGYKAISFWVYGRQDDLITGGWGGFHKAGFTIPALRSLLEEVIGFKVEKIENDGGTNIICWAKKP